MTAWGFLVGLTIFTLSWAYPACRLMWDARSIEERVVLGIALCVDYVLVLAVCVGHEQWARVTAGPSLHV